MAKKNGKIASREMNNGAFVLLLTISIIIAFVVGWFMNAWVSNL